MSFRSSKDHRNLNHMKHGTVRPTDRVGAACAPWTTLLPDAAEGLLSDAEQRGFDQHLSGCPACTEELSQAQRGLAWLTVLKDQVPEPPANMLANILAQTTGMAEAGVMLPELSPVYVAVDLPQNASLNGLVGPSGSPIWSWIRGDEGTWSSLLQPRLAMTGAMAFLSICLTVNLLGISVTQLDAQTFRKGGLQRSVANTGASLVRSIQGLRMVYRVQSRVNEMRAQMDGPAESR